MPKKPTLGSSHDDDKYLGLKNIDAFNENEAHRIADLIAHDENLWEELFEEMDQDDIKKELDYDAIKRSIADKTFQKLDIRSNAASAPDSARKYTRNHGIYFKRYLAFAASLLLLFGIFTSDRVAASIEKLLQYIPGLNVAVESDTDMYALAKPIEVTKGDEKIKIMSVIVDTEQQSLSVSVRGYGAGSKNVSIKFKDGKEYQLPTYSISGSSDNQWNGGYYYISKLSEGRHENFAYEAGDEITVIFKDKENLTASVTLEKPQAFYDYRDLGPTAAKNELSITALPDFSESQLKINLISPTVSGRSIYEYGLRPDYPNADQLYQGLLAEKITLEDESGSIIAGKGLNSYTPPLSEFYFDISDSAAHKFKLTIPHVKLKHDVNQSIEIPLPETGKSLSFDSNPVNLLGYSLKINAIERPQEDKVLIYIDTGFDEKKEDSMLEILLGVKHPVFGKPQYNSWGTNLRESGGEVLEIMLNKPDYRKLDLYIESIIVLKKGPWELNISKP